MTREEMQDVQENASQFVLGLFSFSSLVLKALSLVEAFKARKKKNVKENKETMEKLEKKVN